MTVWRFDGFIPRWRAVAAVCQTRFSPVTNRRATGSNCAPRPMFRRPCHASGRILARRDRQGMGIESLVVRQDTGSGCEGIVTGRCQFGNGLALEKVHDP